jgi:hypothetical protein
MKICSGNMTLGTIKNNLIHRDCLGGANYCRVRRLMVRFVAMYYSCLFDKKFRPVNIIIRYIM